MKHMEDAIEQAKQLGYVPLELIHEREYPGIRYLCAHFTGANEADLLLASIDAPPVHIHLSEQALKVFVEAAISAWDRNVLP